MAIGQSEEVLEAEYDSVVYWKERVVNLEKLLEASLQRERILLEKLQESKENLESESSPVEEELLQARKREDNFLHFILQNAPVVIGHQDKELRYRFIFNHFPGLGEEDIIGKTDVEIFNCTGVEESQDFKKEVLERGLPAKREITFGTELFGSKTFLMYVEPVFSKAGETIGVNYIGMDVTDQVRKREKMAKLKEEMAVQKAKESELDKTIHMTGVTRLEATKFRPREVVKHVLRTAEASLHKLLTLESHVADDVPVEVIGDVPSIWHILTNLVSNAIKFTHEGKVGIMLYVVPTPCTITKQGSQLDQSTLSANTRKDLSMSQTGDHNNGSLHGNEYDGTCENQDKEYLNNEEPVVWIRCDVYATGIGIPENAIPTLFKKYMQVGAVADTHAHARKYGGTGRLAICKQLVQLMGGHLTVSSAEHQGSTFTFVLPYKVSSISDITSDDPDELSDTDNQDKATLSATTPALDSEKSH